MLIALLLVSCAVEADQAACPMEVTLSARVVDTSGPEGAWTISPLIDGSVLAAAPFGGASQMQGIELLAESRRSDAGDCTLIAWLDPEIPDFGDVPRATVMNLSSGGNTSADCPSGFGSDWLFFEPADILHPPGGPAAGALPHVLEVEIDCPLSELTHARYAIDLALTEPASPK